jgi:hypothetical protein
MSAKTGSPPVAVVVPAVAAVPNGHLLHCSGFVKPDDIREQIII